MRSGRILFALGTLTLLVLSFIACAPAEEEAQGPEGGEDWVWLQENKQILDAKRQELKELRDRIAGKLPPEPEAAPAAGEVAEAEEAAEGEQAVPLTPEELEAQATALEEEINTLTDELASRLATFLNSLGLVVGGELNELQRQAIDMKIDEDMVIAHGWIDEGGDYQRAISIYNDAMRLDPGNQRLTDAIAEAEELRHMSPERFEQVKRKMTQDEVRELLGPVNLRNVREFPEDQVLGWFYPKLDGGAAGVYFKERNEGEGDWVVYNVDYEAVPQQVIGGEEGEEGDEGDEGDEG